MTQYQYAKWLYEQSKSEADDRWEALDAKTHNLWVRLAAFIQSDRQALSDRLNRGLDSMWRGLGTDAIHGLGHGYGLIKEVRNELTGKPV